MRSSSIFLTLFSIGCGYSGGAKDPAEQDLDGDGYTAAEGDCAPQDETMNPGLEDTVGDGIDQNCDLIDGTDADGDGFASLASGGDDCDDTTRDVKPGAFDAWYDGVDADCAGDSDFDRDLDGLDSDDYGGTDCNDNNADIPGDEIWNAIDDDCDGCVDEITAQFSYMDDANGDPIMVVTLSSADPTESWMGLAETSQGGAGYYGEDCLNGVGCHHLDASGGTFFVVDDTTNLHPGTETYFDEGRLPGSAAIFRDTRGQCTVMGEGVEYYETEGCCVQEGW